MVMHYFASKGLRAGGSLLLCMAGAAFLAGCVATTNKLVREIKPSSNVVSLSKEDYGSYGVKRIAVLPFKNETGDTGAGFKIAAYFYEQLSSYKEYEVSPPLREDKKIMRIEFVRPRMGDRLDEAAARFVPEEQQESGKSLPPPPEEALDAVVTGRIFRYQDRGGTPLLTLAPASVSYEIYLISIKDGSILWQAAYEETQQPLDENLLLLGRYVENGFWWWTRDRMTRTGMKRIIKTFPGIITDSKQENDKLEF